MTTFFELEAIPAQKRMKSFSKIISNTLASALLLTTFGCAIGQQVRSARSFQALDTIPDGSAKGYVEFSSMAKDAAVPIYLLGAQHEPQLLAGTGIKAGDHYSFKRHQTEVAEKVRVALPPGQYQFIIQKDGQVLQVPVEEGKVTRVQLNYVLLIDGDLYGTYRLTCFLSDPVPLNDPKAG